MPLGRHHGASEMSAGGVAVHHDALAGAQPHEQACVPDLLDDLGDGDFRSEIVADHPDCHAVRVESARHVAEQRRVERAPVAAMDEQRERRCDVRARREKIDELARRRSVAEPELGAPFLHGFGAIVLGLARPACEDFRVFGHAGAVVVFGFVVDGHVISPCSPLYHLFPPAGRGRGGGGEKAAPCSLIATQVDGRSAATDELTRFSAANRFPLAGKSLYVWRNEG